MDFVVSWRCFMHVVYLVLSKSDSPGKFWHRHHRPRPVEYNSNPEFHTRKGNDSKIPAQKNKRTVGAKGAATLASSVGVSSLALAPTANWDIGTEPWRSHSPPPDEDDGAISPTSTASSTFDGATDIKPLTNARASNPTTETVSMTIVVSERVLLVSLVGD